MTRSFVAFVAVAASSLGMAQMNNFDVYASNLQILGQSDVQAEIGITSQQRTKMNAHVDSARAKTKKLEEDLRKQGKDPSRIAPDDPVVRRHAESLKRAVLAELSPTQLRRLREISLQAVGIGAVMDPQVASRIGVSEPQRKQMVQTFKASRERAVNLQRNAVNQATAEFRGRKPKNEAERAEMQKSAQAKAEAALRRVQPEVRRIESNVQAQLTGMLSETQKQKFRDLQGKPFKKPATSFDPR